MVLRIVVSICTLVFNGSLSTWLLVKEAQCLAIRPTGPCWVVVQEESHGSLFPSKRPMVLRIVASICTLVFYGSLSTWLLAEEANGLAIHSTGPSWVPVEASDGSLSTWVSVLSIWVLVGESDGSLSTWVPVGEAYMVLQTIQQVPADLGSCRRRVPWILVPVEEAYGLAVVDLGPHGRILLSCNPGRYRASSCSL